MQDKKPEAVPVGAAFEVMNRQEVMNSLLAPTAKKAEGKKRKSPTTPKEKKGRGKKHRRGFSRKPSFACGRGRVARAHARGGAA